MFDVTLTAKFSSIRLSELTLTISLCEIKDKMSKLLIIINFTYWYSGIWCKVHLRHLYHMNSQHWHLLLQKNTTSYFHTCPRPHVCQYDYTLCICNEHHQWWYRGREDGQNQHKYRSWFFHHYKTARRSVLLVCHSNNKL